MLPSPARVRPRTDAFMRLMLLLLLSGLLHWTVLEWADGKIRPPSMAKENSHVMLAQLHAPTAVTTAAPPPALARPKPEPRKRPARRKPRPEPHARVPVAPTPQAQISPLIAPAEIGNGEQPFADAETTLAQTETAAATDDDVTADAIDNASAEALTPPIVLPPPADLEYAVQALRDGNIVHGHGKIGWRSDGNQYAVTGEAGILFFSVLDFRSKGTVDAAGIAPVLYSEKRFRRPQTNTHFQRERQLISFSASTVSYPRQGGEQDRASIVWQLAGLGAGGGRFVPGAEIPVFVAGVRNGETWQIQVIGQEEIESGIGKLTVWHVTRKPRPGSYDQTLDIWLAPQQHWYPVKLRFTEANGEYLDMTLADLTPVSAPVEAPNAGAGTAAQPRVRLEESGAEPDADSGAELAAEP